MSDEQLQAAVERVAEYIETTDTSGELKALFDCMAGEEAITDDDLCDILCGRMRRQLEEWGWDIIQSTGGETSVLLFGGAGAEIDKFGDTLLDCYTDALIWARERRKEEL